MTHAVFYTLDENFERPVPCDSMLEYSAWLGTLDDGIKTPVGYVVARDSLDGCEVSTVYLGIDHSFSGEHVLWETMIFGGESSMYQERYTSHADAVAGHKRICDAIEAGEIL